MIFPAQSADQDSRDLAPEKNGIKITGNWDRTVLLLSLSLFFYAGAAVIVFSLVGRFL